MENLKKIICSNTVLQQCKPSTKKEGMYVVNTVIHNDKTASSYIS